MLSAVLLAVFAARAGWELGGSACESARSGAHWLRLWWHQRRAIGEIGEEEVGLTWLVRGVRDGDQACDLVRWRVPSARWAHLYFRSCGRDGYAVSRRAPGEGDEDGE